LNNLQIVDSDPEPSVTAKAPEMEATKGEKVSVGISGDWLNREVKKIEQGVAREFRKELNSLYTNFQNDRIAQDSSATARQEAVLRLISSTLTNNVEKTMAHIIGVQISQIVVPSITTVTSTVLQAQVGDAVAKTLQYSMPRELNAQLPTAIAAAIATPQLHRMISENVGHHVTKAIESQLTGMINNVIIPTFKQYTAVAAQEAASKVETELMAEIRTLEANRLRDASRMEKFGQIVEGMAETLQTMSETQIAFQSQIAHGNQQLVLATESTHSRQVSAAPSPLPAPLALPAAVSQKSKEEVEYDEISQLMQDGKYEEGSIKWLHSSSAQQVALFDTLFVRFTPEYLATDVSALVAFSIALTVGGSLQTNTSQRLEWILAAFNAIDITVRLTCNLVSASTLTLTVGRRNR
jgi:hypothetical protein